MKAIRGYDGIEIKVGDRIEAHPATDLWMRGARFGTVKEIHAGIAIASMDKTKGPCAFTGEFMRKVD